MHICMYVCMYVLSTSGSFAIFLQIAVVTGPCTAGGAYVPTMCDEVVIVEKSGSLYLGGPPLVRAATGEDLTSEELGGARVHCTISGCTDHFATSEQEAMQMARNIVACLNLPINKLARREKAQPPAYDTSDEAFASLIPDTLEQSWPMLEVRLISSVSYCNDLVLVHIILYAAHSSLGRRE